MQHREHALGGGFAAFVTIHGNAAAVVDDGDRIVDVNGDVDLIAVPCQRFVNRVVDDFVDEVMQPRRARRPDVHGGPLPHRLEPFENLDLVGAVVVTDRAVPIRARGLRRVGGMRRVGLVGLLLGMFHACP